MYFCFKPTISSYKSFLEFYEDKNISKKDLIVTTSKEALQPYLKDVKENLNIIYVMDYVKGEPNDEVIDKILGDIKEIDFETVVAVGGGTVLDISKLLIFEKNLTCGEIFEKGSDLKKVKKLIAIPTTCGTGSEVTCISICEFIQKKIKIGLAIPQLYPDEAVLIPELLNTLPYEVFAASAIDALVHAVESFISPKASDFSKLFSKEAIIKILNGFIEVAKDNKKYKPLLNDFLIASCFAGVGFSNAGCAAVHALSYLLGANFHIPHGKANYYVFTSVFKEYKKLGADLEELERVLSFVFNTAQYNVWNELENVLKKVLPLIKLSEFGLNEQLINEFSESVLINQKRLLVNNPIELSISDIKNIYTRCL